MAKKEILAGKSSKTERDNRKHFIIYNNGGVISATTPKDWARAHRNFFPKFTFENAKTTPTVAKIESYLSNNLGFELIADAKIVVHYIYVEI